YFPPRTEPSILHAICLLPWLSSPAKHRLPKVQLHRLGYNIPPHQEHPPAPSSNEAIYAIQACPSIYSDTNNKHLSGNQPYPQYQNRSSVLAKYTESVRLDNQTPSRHTYPKHADKLQIHVNFLHAWNPKAYEHDRRPIYFYLHCPHRKEYPIEPANVW